MKRIVFILINCLLCISMFSQVTNEQNDETRRLFIKDFISIYEQAYEKKRIDYISAFFSTDALIITETKELIKNGTELAPKSTKKRPYKLIVEDKKRYIERLTKIFQSNVKIQLSLSNIKIINHPKYKEIYGVAFNQMWKDQSNGNNIEDNMLGYVFLLIDFKTKGKTPIIHVRTWQPNSNIKKPTDKFTIYDFHIYETK